MGLTQMALWGSGLILCIMAVRLLALRHLPKTVFLILWEISALRLLLPVALVLPQSPLPLPEQTAQALPGAGFPAPSGLLAESGQTLLPWLWGLGTVVSALWFLWAYGRSCRVLRAGLPFSHPAGADWLKAHPLLRTLTLRESDQIRSPLTYGIFRPVIVLPKAMPTEALETVLAHEYVHVRRFDALAKLVFAGALCLHWWNPLVWGMYVLANRDMELSCDAAALRLLGGERRRDYAMTLLDLEERRQVKAPLCSYFSGNIMKERIESIMKFQKTSSAALAAAVLLILSTTAAFAVEQKTPDGENGKPPAAAQFGGGQELDLSQFQTMELEDGSILYAPKGVDLERAKEDLDMELVTYTVTPVKADPQNKTVSLDVLPQEELSEPLEEAALGELVSVSHRDEERFSPEEWAEILDKIDRGEITWED